MKTKEQLAEEYVSEMPKTIWPTSQNIPAEPEYLADDVRDAAKEGFEAGYESARQNIDWEWIEKEFISSTNPDIKQMEVFALNMQFIKSKINE
jgi:hypothetical protein